MTSFFRMPFNSIAQLAIASRRIRRIDVKDAFSGEHSVETLSHS